VDIFILLNLGKDKVGRKEPIQADTKK